MKTFLISIIILIITCFSSAAVATMINPWDQVSMTVDGSKYIMTNQDSTGEWDVYQTFCLERYEYFNPGTVYNVASVTDYAEAGGVDLDEPIDYTPGKDYISDTTKWLYASYFEGDFGIQTNELSYMVQKAIWHEEDELADSTAWDILTDGIIDFSTSGWDIKVINLEQKGAYVQSQLVGAPVPEPATMLLFGFGLLGLAGTFRQKNM